MAVQSSLRLSAGMPPSRFPCTAQERQRRRGRVRVAASSVILAKIPPPRTRTQRSGSRPKRRSKGANVASAVRRKRSRADFATTQSPIEGQSGTSPVDAETRCYRHSEAEGRGIPQSGAHAQPWTRKSCVFFRHPREAGIPHAGAGQYAVVTCTNQQGDSRAERENDSRFSASLSLPVRTNGGFPRGAGMTALISPAPYE